MQDQQTKNLDELAAALNQHEVTGNEGQIGEATPVTNTAGNEETPEELVDTAEKPVEENGEEPKPQSDSSENDDESQLATDDTGKQYIPKTRFDKVYGKMRTLERELENAKSRHTENPISEPTYPQTPSQPLNPIDSMEVELMKSKMPEFDPNSDQYDASLDELGAKEYRAAMVMDKKGNLVPGINRIEAARRALLTAAKMGRQIAKERQEARQIASQNSDTGITSRVTSRVDVNNIPSDDASLEEMEAYLRRTGDWNKF